MADNRMVHLGFWNDKYIQSLSKELKLLYIYLLTNERTLICGLYEITEKTIANETELDIEFIKESLKKFTEDKKVFYDNGLIFIPKYAFYQSASKLGRFKEHIEKTFNRFSTIQSLSLYAFCTMYKDIIKHLFSEALLNSLKELMNNEQCTMSYEQGTMNNEHGRKKTENYTEDFEEFYKIYDYDSDKREAYRQWQNKHIGIKQNISKKVKEYVLKTPKQFRVKPEKYIAKVWEDEIIDRRPINGNGFKSQSSYFCKYKDGTEMVVNTESYPWTVITPLGNECQVDRSQCYVK